MSKNGVEGNGSEIGSFFLVRTVYFLCLALVSVSIKLAEQSGVIREEPTYKFDALVSDIGGALGLICGLSILDLLIFVTNFVRNMVNNILKVKFTYVLRIQRDVSWLTFGP